MGVLDISEVFVASDDGVVEVDDFVLFVEVVFFVVDVADCEQIFLVVDD